MTTYKDVYDTVVQIAHEKPDYVYEGGDKGCVYMQDRSLNLPGCIVGNALHRLGFTVPWTLEYHSAGEVAYLLVNGLPDMDLRTSPEGFGPVIRDPHLKALNLIQALQDQGEPWGEAVAMAQLQGEDT